MGTPAYCWFVRCAEPWALPAYWDEPGVPGRQSCAAAYAVLWGYPCPPCAYAEWACERLLCPCPCECPCPLCPCECTCPWVGVPEREMDPPARCSASGTYWQSMPFFLQRSQRGVSPVHCDRGRGREAYRTMPSTTDGGGKRRGGLEERAMRDQYEMGGGDDGVNVCARAHLDLAPTTLSASDGCAFSAYNGLEEFRKGDRTARGCWGNTSTGAAVSTMVSNRASTTNSSSTYERCLPFLLSSD